MLDEERDASQRLARVLKFNRDDAPSVLLYRDNDIGHLLCATGRLDFMEERAEAIARDRSRPLEARHAAREILGWKDGEHGGP